MGRILRGFQISIPHWGYRGFLWFGLALVGLSAAWAEQIQKTFPASANASLLLRCHTGKISIKGWDQNQIEIKGNRASDAVDVDIVGEEQKVTVQTHLKRAGISPEESRVDFEIRVPRQATVRVESERGNIVVENVEGNVSVDGVSSEVKLSRLKGYVAARTLDGPIVIQSSEGYVKAESISGDVTFAQVNGSELVGTTNSGVIRYEGDFGLGGTYVLNNYSSPIYIVTSNRASFDLTARAVQGLIENDLAFRPIPLGTPLRSSTPGKFLQGRFNTGKSTVKVTSYSGTIKLQGLRPATAGSR
ncbi:MAG: hypothetical protein HY313_02875 [Acidobacteria bacterium]|nr:hypothetical protein [Acidobacteriota bacterium]